MRSLARLPSYCASWHGHPLGAHLPFAAAEPRGAGPRRNADLSARRLSWGMHTARSATAADQGVILGAVRLQIVRGRFLQPIATMRTSPRWRPSPIDGLRALRHPTRPLRRPRKGLRQTSGIVVKSASTSSGWQRRGAWRPGATSAANGSLEWSNAASGPLPITRLFVDTQVDLPIPSQ